MRGQQLNLSHYPATAAQTNNFMKFPQLKSRVRLGFGAALCVTLGAFALVGCGGGGGSSSGPSNPSATATPRPPTNVSVTVQLRDTAGAPVDGLVTLDGQRRATTAGNAAFINVRGGALVASAEVNGATYNKNFVATSGSNVVQIAINPNTGTTGGATGGTTPPAPGGTTPPAPPF